MILTTVFQKWGESIRDFFKYMDYNAFWGWILLFIGVLSVFLLIIFTQFKRTERDSVKFSAITTVIAAIAIGFGLHLILLSQGLW